MSAFTRWCPREWLERPFVLMEEPLNLSYNVRLVPESQLPFAWLPVFETPLLASALELGYQHVVATCRFPDEAWFKLKDIQGITTL